MSIEIIQTEPQLRDGDDDERIVNYVQSRLKAFGNARQRVEEVWLESWAHYVSTPEALTFLRSRTIVEVGKVNNDWRHKIQDGKAFESTEQIVAYFMQASFPNMSWFDVVPRRPGYSQIAKLVRQYLSVKLSNSNFRSEWQHFLRQLTITGMSTFACYWEDENEESEVEFETIDNFDIWVDPTCADADRAVIRRILKTRADIVESDLYDMTLQEMRELPEMGYDNNQTKKDELMRFTGVQPQVLDMTEQLELYEYWGDIHLGDKTYKDVVATICGNKLLRLEQNVDGTPFVIGSYIPIVRQPYPMGASQPSLGLLHAQNSFLNQRLDNNEICINQMFTLLEGAGIAVEEVFSEPGKVFSVTSHDAIRPVQLQAGNVQTAYEEQQALDRRIDQNYGTIPMVGLGQGRQAERVTATEVQAVRDAGGTRLSNVHKHIEDTSLKPVLKKVLDFYQKYFTKQQDVVRVANPKIAGAYDYIGVEPKDLKLSYSIAPVGAEGVLERQRAVDNVTNFITLVTQIEPFSQYVDFEALFDYLLEKWDFDEPDRFKKAPEQAQPQTPQAQVAATAQEIGGDSMANAMQANDMAGLTPEMMAELSKSMGANVNAPLPVENGAPVNDPNALSAIPAQTM